MEGNGNGSARKVVTVDELAISFSLTAQVGPNRQITLGTAFPLSMALSDMNKYVDKAVSIVDRQNDKGLLEQAKRELEHAQKDVLTNTTQKEQLFNKYATDFLTSGRKGDFKPGPSQKAQLSNYDQTIQNLLGNIIPKYEKTIAELERKIGDG